MKSAGPIPAARGPVPPLSQVSGAAQPNPVVAGSCHLTASLLADASAQLTPGASHPASGAFSPVREVTTHETVPPHIEALRAKVARWGSSRAKPAQEARAALYEAVHQWMGGAL